MKVGYEWVYIAWTCFPDGYKILSNIQYLILSPFKPNDCLNLPLMGLQIEDYSNKILEMTLVQYT